MIDTEQERSQQAIKIGKFLLMSLCKEYVFTYGFTKEQLEATGESRDDIAYSCWSYATVEALNLTPEIARYCIFAALEDLEANYKLKPANLQKHRQRKHRRN